MLKKGKRCRGYWHLAKTKKECPPEKEVPRQTCVFACVLGYLVVQLGVKGSQKDMFATFGSP